MNDPFIYIAGETRSFGAGNENAFLLKVDVEGGDTIPEFGSLALPFLLVMVIAACTVCAFFRRRK